MIKKTIEDIEVGDIIISPTGKVKCLILIVIGDTVVLTYTYEGSGVFKYHRDKIKNWTVEQPLTVCEEDAKKLLEEAGFKVTR